MNNNKTKITFQMEYKTLFDLVEQVVKTSLVTIHGNNERAMSIKEQIEFLEQHKYNIAKDAISRAKNENYIEHFLEEKKQEIALLESISEILKIAEQQYKELPRRIIRKKKV